MLSLYNTIKRKKEIFKPQKGKTVKIYSCGPTVYDFAHIGNYRSYSAWDVLIRYLKFLGYETKVVKNITDVGHLTEDETDEGEDKMEKAARREKKKPLEIARFYTKFFLEEEKKLNILPPDFRPKASEEIEMIQKITKGLLSKKYAYETEDGVYFDVSKFKKYGKLSGNTPGKILSGARIEINPNKKHPADFALWKKRVGENKSHSLFWKSPWGDGFPGWHIECSAMAMHYLGKQIDIHTGGRDNIFPHHESEIAQSEAFTGQILSRFWLHTGLVDVDGKKMSKSLGNFYTLRQIEEKGFSPLLFRFWTLLAHYRNPIDFSFKALKEAEINWRRVCDFRDDVWREVLKQAKLKKIPLENNERKILLEGILKFHVEKDRIKKWEEKREKDLMKAMDEDLNTPKAIVSLQETLKQSRVLGYEISALLLLEKWDQVFAILPEFKQKKKETIPQSIKLLVEKRQKARLEKDFKISDKLRLELEKKGYEIIDKADGKCEIRQR